MNILHIFKNTNEKFYNPFISFINENFNPDNHYFMIEKYTDRASEFSVAANVELVHIRKYLNLIKRLYTSDKIILHSLMSPRIVVLLFFQPWLLKKCYWVIWGGDLYAYQKKKTTIKQKTYEYMRSEVIKNMEGMITYIKGSYDLAVKWYSAKGKYYKCNMYLSNVYKDYNDEKIDKSKVYIMVGNSADPSNNHMEVFDKLKNFKNQNVEIICPLSYGHQDYKKKVIEEGSKLFGSKFNALVEFLCFQDYLEILRKVDIAVFNHKRSQAMGNIITLLGMGKKVYVRDDITTWKTLRELGVNTFSFNNETIEIEFSEAMAKENNVIIKKNFSYEALLTQWKAIFEN